jgi:(p)ppGpp synthase/HD superfamily hydrolase
MMMKTFRHCYNEAREDFDEKFWPSYDFAKRKHDATRAIRRASGKPYIVHPDAVAKIVDAYGGDDDQVKIAMLHDTLEDTDASYEDIVDLDGDEIANDVRMLTNDRDSIDRLGKEEYMNQKLLSLPNNVLFIKLADMLHNIEDAPSKSQLIRMANNLETLYRERDDLDRHCEELLLTCLDTAEFQLQQYQSA